jgi:pimeloyl-ACP methyl ester carboxylesterase
MTMPDLELDRATLHYTEVGTGEQTVVFSHSYLADHTHFASQIHALESQYRIIAYDHRAHGKSSVPPPGYSMEDIYDDGVKLVEKLGVQPCHWVGLSTGGFVGMRIAFRRPELLRSLVLMDTSAESEPVLKRLQYRLMFALVRRFGYAPVRSETMKTFFGPTFLSDPKRADEREHWQSVLESQDLDGAIAFGQAIFSRDDVLDQLSKIATPTLVMVGEHDRATPIAHARKMATAIPGATLQVVPRAGHLSTIEEPEFVNRALTTFLTAH